MAKQKLGALWKRTTKAGKHFLAGVLEQDGVKTKITVWPNDYKEPGSRQPDFIITLDDYDPAKAAAAAAPAPASDPFPTSEDGEPQLPPDEDVPV